MPNFLLNGNPDRLRGTVDRAARRLCALASAGSVASVVVESIRGTLAFDLTDEERRWVEAIERLRAQMNDSGDLLVRMDYGAGDPTLNRDAAQMSAGVEVTETLGHVCRKVSKPVFWGVFLFELVRRFRPRSCIEMGTACGISAAYQSAALALNGVGSLTTLEGAASLAQIARRNFTSLGLDGPEVVVGRFSETLGKALQQHQPVDFVFVDGHHDEEATLGYFEQIFPHVADRALIIFDDIAWSNGMKRAWRLITEDVRVTATIDFGPLGACIVDRPFRKRRTYTLPLSPVERAWKRTGAMETPGVTSPSPGGPG